MYGQQRIKSYTEKMHLLINLINILIMYRPVIADIKVVNHGEKSKSLWNEEHDYSLSIFFSRGLTLSS